MSYLFKNGAIAFVCILFFATPARSKAVQSVVELNPQPEPPSLEIQYRLTPDGADWFGTIYVGGQACGTMQLIQAPPRQTGVATHVDYELNITGSNPAFLLDASMDGVIVRQHVVLNGTIASGYYVGRTIHPRGVIEGIGGGTIDQLPAMQGTIQLNPQPEPPSSFEYPPSPCIQ